MSIEKNLIFLYPLSPVIKEVKKYFEANEAYSIYEMDSLGEYHQLIGILDVSITFSTDMKKTSRYLQENKNFLLSEKALNIAVTNINIPSHIFSKLQRYGLNDIFKENIPIKNLTYKVESFFKKFEGQEERDKLNRQQATTSNEILKQQFGTEKIIGKLVQRKINMHGLTDMEKSGPLIGKISQSSKLDYSPMLLKNLKKLNLPDMQKKIKKRGKFIPAEAMTTKKKTNFVEVERDFKRKRNNFQEVERELEKRENIFKKSENDARKKYIGFEEHKKKRHTQTLLTDTERPRTKFNATNLSKDFRRKKEGTFVEEQRSVVWEAIERTTKKRDIIIKPPHDHPIEHEQSDYNLDGNTRQKLQSDLTLNYNDLRAEFKNNRNQRDIHLQRLKTKRVADEIAKTPELFFYNPGLNGINFLIHLDNIYRDKQQSSLNYLKFIHFSLMKEFNGVISFYLHQQNSYLPLYIGHKVVDLKPFEITSWEEEEENILSQFTINNLPTWLDETLQSKINVFFYPYFYEGVLLGQAVAHFEASVLSHQHAKVIESLLLCAKGVLLESHWGQD